MTDEAERSLPDVDLTDADVTEAMQEIPGYLDITPGDFRELFRVALRHAWHRVRHLVKVVDLMTPQVVTVQPATPLSEVAERMAHAGVSGVPVIDAEGRAVGMISEADFLSRMAGVSRLGFMGVVAQCLQGKQCLAVPVRGRTAGDLMTSPPVTVHKQATATEVAELMSRSGVNRVPVVDGAGVVIGIVSRADLVRAHLL